MTDTESQAVVGETAGAADGTRTVSPEFTGSAAEYFRIWIVNLFLSLVTLGIYSAWAKVRKKRYLYGSTRLDGDTFDYFANPVAILKGRIFALAVFLLYAFGSELYPPAHYAFWAVGLLLFPWLIVKALAFNARNSAYRGVRFDFPATVDDAAKVYIGKLLVVAITLGLAFPWFMARQKAFVVSHHAFGSTRFSCKLPAKKFYGIYIRAGLVLVAATGALTAGIALLVSSSDRSDTARQFFWLVPLAVTYAAYAATFAYVQARTANLLWANTSAAGLQFVSTLSAIRLIKLYIGNILAVAFTAGLMIPWAVIRTLRYRLENLSVRIDDDVGHVANPALASIGAAGQELGDIFNVDLGL